jgi:hypothetical protein
LLKKIINNKNTITKTIKNTINGFNFSSMVFTAVDLLGTDFEVFEFQVEGGPNVGGLTSLIFVEVLSCTHDPLSTEDGVPFKQLPVFFPKLERLYQLLILIMLLF